MESASIARRPRAHEHDEHHGPPAANQSLAGRGAVPRDAAFHHLRDHALRSVLHGLLLHPGRGRRRLVPVDGRRAAGGDRRRQHGDPDLLELHDALGARGRAQREPPRAAGGPAHHRPARPDVPLRSRSTSTSTSASRPATTPRPRSSTASPACTARTCSSASRCSRSPRSAPSAATSRPRSTAASRCPGSTGTSSTSCGSSCTATRLPPLDRVLNPLRSEQEAFRFLLYVVVAVAVDPRGRLRAAGDPLSADLELAERAARAAGEVLLERYGAPAGGARLEVARTPTWSRTPTARPSGRSASCSRPSAPTTACWPRRARAREARQRPALGRRPARRHDQLPLRLPGVGGERRARGRATAGRWAWSTTPVHGETFTAVRGEGARLDGEPAAACASAASSPAALVATGFAYEAERRAEQAEVVARAAPARARHPPRRRGGARPRLAGRRARRRVLRARAEALGLGGGRAAGAEAGGVRRRASLRADRAARRWRELGALRALPRRRVGRWTSRRRTHSSVAVRAGGSQRPRPARLMRVEPSP